MTEESIITWLPMRIKQLGYRDYQVHYRDFIIPANGIKVIEAYNQLWFIVDDPPGIQVTSSYGWYNKAASGETENMHQHRGEIIISNPDNYTRRIKMIQAIIVN